MNKDIDYDELESRAKELYARIQGDDVPSRFRQPDNFSTQALNLGATNASLKQAMLSTTTPTEAAKMFYSTTNSDYGSCDPSIIEMPTQWSGSKTTISRMQNNIVYRYNGFNTEMDKERFMDPYVTIRRK
ncbi:hypothetical protein GMRT_13208 [Giardia muris]|uniref:Uncharacterized protein n=1 Tax=Giardia muris TaxID=5742 RepID=A0A4Z1T862_GIAMU|nr:hypothetical protein GMRT_13208 [Giardia muris]|eukprot:TNJ28681.1 hypothetical protein GMRT_13208 [Giardia muris]